MTTKGKNDNNEGDKQLERNNDDNWEEQGRKRTEMMKKNNDIREEE